jgi:hypothetical protein
LILTDMPTDQVADEFEVVALQPLLLEAAVSSDLDKFVEQSVRIANRHPQLLVALERDLDVHGLKKKHVRETDRHFIEVRTAKLDGLEFELSDRPLACSCTLAEGRPRMPALAVFIFLLLRGWIGGPKGVTFRMLLKESITLHRLLDSLGIDRVPGPSTVLDNINAVGEATQQMILRAQLAVAGEDGLDDMDQCRADSTAVRANSMHPTDSGLMKAFAQRAAGLCERLFKPELPGVPDMRERKEVKAVNEVAEELGKLCRDIGMLSGKRNVATQRKELYEKMYTRVARFERRFAPVLGKARSAVEKAAGQMQLLPSKRCLAETFLQQAAGDLEALVAIAAYSKRRIVEEKQTPAGDKIYSVSDIDAAIIRKGGWQDVLGYKPQLAFSGKGLVTAILVPAGNAADNGQLPELLVAVERNIGKLPRSFTFDDGYTNGAVRDHYIGRGVEVFSYAGANGRHVIGKETYDREDYRVARRARSAAESNIYTLKYGYDFRTVMRRGIEEVRSEMLGKVLAYNMRRLVTMREEKRRAEQMQAVRGEQSLAA